MLLNNVRVNNFIAPANGASRGYSRMLLQDSFAPPEDLHQPSLSVPRAQRLSTVQRLLHFLFDKPGRAEPGIPQSGRGHCQLVISFLIPCVSSFDNPCHT